MKAKKERKTAAGTALKGHPVGTLVAQPLGGALRVGNPGNKGGGRRKAETLDKLDELLALHGPGLVAEIMTGTVKYNFVGTCSHCRKESTGPTNIKEFLDAVSLRTPSPDTRLRSIEAAAKIAWGDKTEIEIVNHPEVQRRIAALRQALIENFGEEAAARAIVRADEIANQ